MKKHEIQQNFLSLPVETRYGRPAISTPFIPFVFFKGVF